MTHATRVVTCFAKIHVTGDMTQTMHMEGGALSNHYRTGRYRLSAAEILDLFDFRAVGRVLRYRP
ncbi:hypothetical protein NY08_117 [Rhodococcus sp. B7740]|nr:hypothetical protein NY08_117 [Rhodococcus sp. B7740]